MQALVVLLHAFECVLALPADTLKRMFKRRISIVDYPHLSQYSSHPALRTVPTRRGSPPRWVRLTLLIRPKCPPLTANLVERRVSGS